jgi:myo-inositol-1(or 4)-monophosphatase
MRKLYFGIVHEINRNEQFHAIKGNGAFMNETKIQVTDTNKLENSLIATGFPYDEFDREEQYWKALRTFTHKTRGIRRLGSAAVDLCYVACGRFDCFFEYSLSPWDVAGGALVVKEAGGKVTDFSGGENWLMGKEIVATNGIDAFRLHGNYSGKFLDGLSFSFSIQKNKIELIFIIS